MNYFKILVLVFIFKFSHSQNLIPNHSFEDVNICAEHNAPCSPAAWCFLQDQFGYYKNNLAIEGDSYISVKVSGKTLLPYAQTQILCQLEKGKQYLLSFYLASPNKIKFNDDVDIYFALSTEKLLKEFNNAETILLIKKEDVFKKIKINKVKWYYVQLTFTATGGEKYLTIGNILKDRGSINEKKKIYALDALNLEPADSIKNCSSNMDSLLKILYSDKYRHPPYRDMASDEDNRKEDSISHTLDTPLHAVVLFDNNDFSLKGNNIEALDSIAEAIKKINYNKILIIGYTDSIGSKGFNKQLSEKRANAVLNYLIKNHPINGKKVTAIGKGEATSTLENNFRRVEIIIN